MNEHTKGPWHYQEASDAYTHIVRDSSNIFILSAPQGTSGECEANARLAAAAPELLEALKEAFIVMAGKEGSNSPFDMERWVKAVNGIEAAIAKAEVAKK